MATKRIGRPPVENRVVDQYHLGMRFPDELRDKLAALVIDANERAKQNRLPADITASSLVRSWIVERVDGEYNRLALTKKKR